MQSCGIALLTSLSLVLLSCAACGQKESGTKPQTAPAANQATHVDIDFDRSHIVRLRGVLRDHEGKRLTGGVGVFFAVYEEQEGGAPLWQEVQNVLVDAQGHFIALVGSTTTEGIPAELFATEKMRWLGKQVLMSGEVEQPRIRLLKTPGGLMAMRFIGSVLPEESDNQPAGAETQKASDQAADKTADSQQDESANRPSGSKRRLHRRRLTP